MQEEILERTNDHAWWSKFGSSRVEISLKIINHGLQTVEQSMTYCFRPHNLTQFEHQNIKIQNTEGKGRNVAPFFTQPLIKTCFENVNTKIEFSQLQILEVLRGIDI